MSTENEQSGSLHAVVLRLREQLKCARRLLNLYDSPFPDAQEKAIRSKQASHVRNLELELRRAEEKAQNVLVSDGADKKQPL